ncbi:Polygalacturonase QRT2 [Forsythia ovata]|uniref:endo-polygalacturonase n=1 Tax=Forsythia ovata TaxID=205694 RepID=A0ABD1TP98_9LAMI
MMPKFFSFTLLIILISSSSCFGINPQNVHPSSKHFHDIHSESPTVALKSSVLINQHKEKFLNFNQFNHVTVHGARRSRHTTINVDNFGAKADGQTDDSQAFRNAWDMACNSSKKSIFLVPKHKTYYIRRINFTGPCKSSMKVEIKGTIKAFSELYEDTERFWIKFQKLRNFEVRGGGTIDGNGEIWWKNSCKIKKSSAMTFENCMNLKVNNLHIQNSQQMHLIFEDCVNVKASNLKVTAPETSPNTDGIHVTKTQNIEITSSDIKTGDDCISIVNGSKNIRITNIVCGPGHGISIGSLGEDHSENYVSDVLVDGVMLSGTKNGVRIKTWQGGSGCARNIIFKNIEMDNVFNPIIIDQNYCDQDESCQEQKSAVQVMDVVYNNIRGTSASEVAIKLDCSDTVPCKRIVLDDVNLSRQGEGEVKANCSNIIGFDSLGTYVFPRCPNFSN